MRINVFISKEEYIKRSGNRVNKQYSILEISNSFGEYKKKINFYNFEIKMKRATYKTKRLTKYKYLAISFNNYLSKSLSQTIKSEKF